MYQERKQCLNIQHQYLSFYTTSVKHGYLILQLLTCMYYYYITVAVAERLKCLSLNPGVWGLTPTWGHNNDSTYDTSASWFKKADSRCDNIFQK